MQNTPLYKTTSEKNTRKDPHESSTGKSGVYGNFGDADKGGYLSGQEKSEERFSAQLIPSWEAVIQRCSVKKVFLEISQNSQENMLEPLF